MLNDTIPADEQIDWSFLRNISQDELMLPKLVGLSTSQFYHRGDFLLSLYEFLRQQGISFPYFFSSDFLELYNIAIEEQSSEKLVLELEKGPHEISEASSSEVFALKQKALAKQKQWEENNKKFMNLLKNDGLESHFLDLSAIIKNKEYQFIKRWKTFKNEYDKLKKKDNSYTDYKIAIDKEAKHYLKRRKISYIETLFDKKVKELTADLSPFNFSAELDKLKESLRKSLEEIQEKADAIYGTEEAFKCAVLYKIAETALFYCITKKHNIKHFIYPGKISPAVKTLRERFIVNELGDVFQWLGLESQALAKIKSERKERLGTYSEGNFSSDGSDSDTSTAELRLMNDGKQLLTPRNSSPSSPPSSPKKLSKASKKQQAKLTTDKIDLNNDDMPSSLEKTYLWVEGYTWAKVLGQLARDSNVPPQVIVDLCKKIPQEMQHTTADIQINADGTKQTIDHGKNPYTLMAPPKLPKVSFDNQAVNTSSFESTRSNSSESDYSDDSDLKSIAQQGARSSWCNIL